MLTDRNGIQESAVLAVSPSNLHGHIVAVHFKMVESLKNDPKRALTVNTILPFTREKDKVCKFCCQQTTDSQQYIRHSFLSSTHLLSNWSSFFNNNIHGPAKVLFASHDFYLKVTNKNQRNILATKLAHAILTQSASPLICCDIMLY